MPRGRKPKETTAATERTDGGRTIRKVIVIDVSPEQWAATLGYVDAERAAHAATCEFGWATEQEESASVELLNHLKAVCELFHGDIDLLGTVYGEARKARAGEGGPGPVMQSPQPDGPALTPMEEAIQKVNGGKS